MSTKKSAPTPHKGSYSNSESYAPGSKEYASGIKKSGPTPYSTGALAEAEKTTGQDQRGS
jgi:hypothetical protein